MVARRMDYEKNRPVPETLSSPGSYGVPSISHERTEFTVRRLSSRIRRRLRTTLNTGLDYELNAADAASALISALQMHDGVTGDHAERARLLAEEVALELRLDLDAVRATSQATALHDIGKICIPERILNKPDKLDEDEWRVMRRHSEIGAEILSRIGVSERVSSAVLAHHERFDGWGYPVGLSGEEIPVEARIIAVVDAYDAMTSDRPYRKAMKEGAALREIERNTGTQFCPAAAGALLKVVGCAA